MAMSERTKAGIRRAVKVFAFQILGTLLINVTAIVAFVLTQAEFDPAMISLLSMLAASAAAGIYKTINWQSVGVEPPAQPDVPPLQLPTPEKPSKPSDEEAQG